MKINWPEKDDTDIDYGAGWNACLEACKKAAAIQPDANSNVMTINVGDPTEFGVSMVFGETERALLAHNVNSFISRYLYPCLLQISQEIEYRQEQAGKTN